MSYRYFWGPLPAGCLRILGGHFWSSQVWKDSHTSVYIYIYIYILHMNITNIYIYIYIYITSVYIYIYIYITCIYIYIYTSIYIYVLHVCIYIYYIWILTMFDLLLFLPANPYVVGSWDLQTWFFYRHQHCLHLCLPYHMVYIYIYTAQYK